MPTSTDHLADLDIPDTWSTLLLEQANSARFREMLDALPAAIYTTDALGRLTYFNRACVEFSGRTPTLGSDRWCVTWKLFHPDGTPMPHDTCPMAVALKEGRSIQGAEAIAERPDGSRIWFMPHPTPLRDADGQICGGINMLVDITHRKRQESALRTTEKKLRRILETDAVAVLFFDSRGTLIDANDVFLRMTGYRRDQIECGALTWRSMTPPEWVAATEEQLQQFAHTGRIGPYEKEYLLADGSRRWMRFAGRDLGDGIIAEFCIDIAETKRREAASAALADLGSQIITADKPEVIYEKIVDAAVTLMRSDFASMQLFHPERGDAGELELLAHRGFDPDSVKFWKWVSGKSTCVCGLTLRAGSRVIIPDTTHCDRLDDGQKKAYREAGIRAMQSTPLISRSGKLVGMISTHWRNPHHPSDIELRNFDILARQAADVIERQQATAGLARAKEEAEAANIAKDNFLATLSHELRTPLTPVLATLSSWEVQPSFPKELAEDLQIVRRNIDLEARLIDDLLDLTRIAKGKIALNLEVLDVQHLLDAVINMYLSDIRGKRIRLSVQRQASHCHVRADTGRLQQAFWNILKNAVKFTPEGGAIDIATRNHPDNHVQIVITDNGAGISPHMLPRLFQPFEQETAGRYGGLGLGLAITKALLEAQQGSIEARSEGLGKGATFIITLPCVPQPLAAASPADPASTAPPANRCCRILLCEDHPDTARVLARLLAINGHTVTTASSIADALTLLRERDFDLLLSDIGLPDGTGIDLIRAVRLQLHNNLPAVALTGFGMEDDVKRTLLAGFNAHLTKPVNFSRLEQTLQHACRANA